MHYLADVICVILCVMSTLDATDARLLLALDDDPQATRVDLAQRLELSRNTVHARLTRWEDQAVLGAVDHRVMPKTLGYSLTAFVTIQIDQHRLDELTVAMTEIPEVLEVHGLTGVTDLLIHVVGRDANDLYRIAGRILSIDGVKRTSTGLVMQELMGYRIAQLIGTDSRPSG